MALPNTRGLRDYADHPFSIRHEALCLSACERGISVRDLNTGLSFTGYDLRFYLREFITVRIHFDMFPGGLQQALIKNKDVVIKDHAIIRGLIRSYFGTPNMLKGCKTVGELLDKLTDADNILQLAVDMELIRSMPLTIDEYVAKHGSVAGTLLMSNDKWKTLQAMKGAETKDARTATTEVKQGTPPWSTAHPDAGVTVYTTRTDTAAAAELR